MEFDPGKVFRSIFDFEGQVNILQPSNAVSTQEMQRFVALPYEDYEMIHGDALSLSDDDAGYLVATLAHPLWARKFWERDAMIVAGELPGPRKDQSKPLDATNPDDRNTFFALNHSSAGNVFIENYYLEDLREWRVNMPQNDFRHTPQEVQGYNIDSARKAWQRVKEAYLSGQDLDDKAWFLQLAFELHVNYRLFTDLKPLGITLEQALKDETLVSQIRASYSALPQITRDMDDSFINESIRVIKENVVGVKRNGEEINFEK